MRMGPETRAGGDAVFIDNAKRAEGLKLCGLVGGETEGVKGVEPVVICVAAGGPGTFDH